MGIYPFGSNLYQKNTIFVDISWVQDYFLKSQRWNLAWGCRSGTFSILVSNSVLKIAYKDITLQGKFILKLPILGIFGYLSHFSSDEIWLKNGPRNPSTTKSRKNGSRDNYAGHADIALPRKLCILIYSFLLDL